MSDVTKTLRVETPARVVIRNAEDRLYYVYHFVVGEGWEPILGRGYRHSTSAYAALGRMVNRDIQLAVTRHITHHVIVGDQLRCEDCEYATYSSTDMNSHAANVVWPESN